MREPPADLPTERLRACMCARYGLAVDALTFLPLGNDSAAWVYRVQSADGSLYFLKVRAHAVDVPRLLVPRYLHDHGIARVVAPLPTTAGTLWTDAAGYVLILYPFVAGTTGMERGMSERQWIEYGRLVRQVHTAALTPALARVIERESFVPVGVDTVRTLDAHIGVQAFDDPAASALATFWQARRQDILTVVDRAEALGRRLAGQPPPCVLCHADIHTNNVLLDAAGQVWIVDWDDTLLAPKECDLMFAVGGIIRGLVGPREEELFFQGYGPTTVDPLGLAYYRHVRAVGDMAADAEQVFLRPDLGSVTRHAAVDGFMRLFEPGNIVTLAFASEQ